MTNTNSINNAAKNEPINSPFLKAIVQQIRGQDVYGVYRNWSDELLLDRLIMYANKDSFSEENLNLDPLNQLLTNAFYHAIGATIETITGYSTDTYVHLRNKEFSSAVVSCNGVLVLYSLIWGYRSLGFLSIQELIESAETYIQNAIAKASLYFDF